MKRSRTCQCLVELDSPKRTRSTPDLAALRRKHNTFERERTLDDSMMTASAKAGLDGSPFHILWRASSPAATASKIAAAAAAEAAAIASVPAPVPSSDAFVVDSVVRRGSLNEITILEHEQFIGEERAAGLAGAVGRRSPGLLLFGGASPSGLLDDDSGDSSDYFCGVASSDEADEDSRCETGTTTTIAADTVAGSGSGSGFGAPCVITPNMSDAESTGQVSDASSHAAAKDHAGRDDADAKVHADGAVSPLPSAAPPSSWDKPGHCGFSASFPPTRFAGGSAWRQRQQQQPSSSCSSRVTVRVMSSLGVSGDLGGVSSPLFSEEGREEEKDRHTTNTTTTTQTTRQTVSPPWPFSVSASAWRGTPASAPAAFYGDSLAAAAAGGVYVVPEGRTGGRQQYRGSDGGGSNFSTGEEVKFLGGFDRLRLVDHPTKPSIVGMGSLDPVWSCRGRSSSLGGGGMEVEVDTALL